ncbi:hypothetical protein NLI96_g9535 [Meripilus lineatus]|uniref:Mediator of RNA polymerase II transcription subunit 8 n=1 Tax=Meripilus lineatus TaxID=2056292 RepID=A0AAD5UWU7_9APHY|nr:hypothetical protein NLI96_g9535 [Physisporinus lineatus]
MSQPTSQAQQSQSQTANPTLAPSLLPVGQLESLKFKSSQIIESIQALQWTLEAGNQNFMPSWPDILSKYNILLSQSHSLSTSLFSLHTQHSAPNSQSPFEQLALHPNVGMTDAQLENDLIPLLRNQQTTDVLKMENDIVRRLSEHMSTKGSLGVLAPPPNAGLGGLARFGSMPKRTEYEDVLRECDQIRVEHDARCTRAENAVNILRDKYDWKARVEVEQEEPEELEWDPRLQDDFDESGGKEGGAGGYAGSRHSNDTDEEEELEEVLGNGEHTPEATPKVVATEIPMVES